MNKLRALVSGVLVFAIVLVGVIGVTWAVSAQYEASPTVNYSAVDDPHVADVGNTTQVDAPDYALSYLDNETITDSSGTQLSEGTDYEWNTSTGEIYWYNSTDVEDGEEMKVEFAYRGKTEQARSAKSILAIPIDLVFPAALLVVVAMSVAGLAAGMLAAVRSLDYGRGTGFSRR
jgi:hypothetical protein